MEEVDTLKAEIERLRAVLADWGGKMLAKDMLSHTTYKKAVYNK